MCNGYEKIHKADEEKTMQTTLRGINVKNSHGDVYSYIRENGEPVNLWEKDEDGKYKTYNILFIVRNRSVEVYYKEKNQDISVLGILRAKYVDVNTYGYVAVFGANGVSFEISDFKLTNLSIA